MPSESVEPGKACGPKGGREGTEVGGTRGAQSISFISSLGMSDPRSHWVSLRQRLFPPLSISDFVGPGPLPHPVARHSVLCGYWLAGPVSHSSPSSSISISDSASLWPFPLSFLICAFLLQVSPISLSPSLSLSRLLSVFAHLQLCLSPSLVSPRLYLSQSLPARVGPGGSGTARPGRRCEQCPIHAASQRHGNAPAPPAPRAGRSCQEDAMVTSGACPPRALVKGPGQQGALGGTLCLESGLLQGAFSHSLPQCPLL